jgi:hypothetical protein
VNSLAASTTATVPWWYVAALAGGFTIFGALLTLTGLLITARRKNRLDDSRRFDTEVIAAWVTMDKAVDVMHNNLGETQEDNDAWWDTYRAVISTVAKLQLITSSDIYSIAERMRILMVNMAPKIGEAYVMPELVVSLDELRMAIRARLRIEEKPKVFHPEPHGLRAVQWRIEERLEERRAKRAREAVGGSKLAEDEIPSPDEPPFDESLP